MNRRLSCVAWDENAGLVARCLEVAVTSDGDTEDSAVENLREALELYVEDRRADLAELPARRCRLGQVVVRPPRS